MSDKSGGGGENIVLKAIGSLKKRGLLGTVTKIFRYPFELIANARGKKQIFASDNLEDRFSTIYEMNYWREGESASGTGSTFSYTENVRAQLPQLFSAFEIATVFDAPCGDFNWMKHVVEKHPLTYIGGDIVKAMIDDNNTKYQKTDVDFIHIDLTSGDFPDADLMICRDCLFHLSVDDTRTVLQNFCASNIAYLLTTTHLVADGFQNTDIESGDFRRIDLFSAPYNLPTDVLFRFDDWQEPEPEKEMCLWRRDQVAAALENWGA